MRVHFSDFFGVPVDTLSTYGAFNISLINDLPLFIDPFLLFNSSKPEYQQLHQEILNYIKFLRDETLSQNVDQGLIGAWFHFREVKQTWLGYSKIGNRGSGLGRIFAESLHKNLNTVFSDFGQEKVTKSSHVEKLGLIRGGVGRDHISDFTTNLIKDFLLEYTQTFALRHIEDKYLRSVAIPKVRFNYATRSWESRRFKLPFWSRDNSTYVILTPSDLLTRDETWINRDGLINDFDEVLEAMPNAQLRSQLNDYLARSLPVDAKRKEVNEVIQRIIEDHPEVIDHYIRYKEDHAIEATSVSDRHVQEAKSLFIENLSRLLEILFTQTKFYETQGSTYSEARERVFFLKNVIENKGGHRIFYIDGKPIRRESDLQILFRLTWYATPSDISREVNDGRGPVDFVASRGSTDKTLIEFKLASNTHLRKNLERQVEVYQAASDAQKALRVILYFTDSELTKLERTLLELGLSGDRDIILIDGRSTNKPSGSIA